jgi:hypothetical protein
MGVPLPCSTAVGDALARAPGMTTGKMICSIPPVPRVQAPRPAHIGDRPLQFNGGYGTPAASRCGGIVRKASRSRHKSP